MNGVNKVILLGTLGKDPEIRQAGQNNVANFSIATSEKFTDRAGQKQEKTEWHSIVLWGKLADLAGQYLKKGDSVYIEGKLTTRSWDENGQKRYKTEIVGNTMQFINTGRSQQQQTQQYQAPQMPPAPQPIEEDLPF